MDSKAIIMFIMSLSYYVGIASCAAQGAEKGKHEYSIPVLHYITNAFGGGYVRDVIFLGVSPWLLTLSALPDIVLVVLTGILYSYYFCIGKADQKKYDIAVWLVTITDIFGIPCFIYKGIGQAVIYNSSNALVIIACGYVTALGGGLLASGESLTKIFKSRKKVCYHFVTLFGCWYYYTFRHSLSLVCVVAIGLFLANMDYRTLCNSLITVCLETFLLYPAVCNKSNNFQRQKIIKDAKKFDICFKLPRIYLIQHRIRQC